MFVLIFILHIPKSARPLGHHGRPYSQLPPTLPVLGLSQGLTQFQARLFSDVVLPSLSLSASCSRSLPCALQDWLGKPFWPQYISIPPQFAGFFLTLVRRSSKGPIECCISFLTSSLVMWSLYKMPRSLWKHLISVACILFSRSLVKAHDSQAYRNMEKTKEHINLIMELSVMFLSLQVILSFVSAAIVCAILAITSNFEIWSVTHYYFELQFVVNCVSYVKDFIHPEIHHQRRNF